MVFYAANHHSFIRVIEKEEMVGGGGGGDAREEYHRTILKCLYISHFSRPREEGPQKLSREEGMPLGR